MPTPCSRPAWAIVGSIWRAWPSGVRECLEPAAALREYATYHDLSWKLLWPKGGVPASAADQLAWMSDQIDALNALPPLKDGSPPAKATKTAYALCAAFAQASGEALGWQVVALAWRPAGSRAALAPMLAVVDAERRYALSANLVRTAIAQRSNRLLLTVSMLHDPASMGIDAEPGAFVHIG